ncbi:MAG: FAD-dependent thymidylate synthase [Armatimonadetes bacterium]|nr:FAD-dependent thymidylate synthase [Armatimonadota bacterium]
MNLTISSAPGWTPDETRLLTPYVTSVEAPVFCLRNLPEEVVAVLFAYYSRSEQDLRRNLLKLLEERDLDLIGAPLAPEGEDSEDLARAREKAREFHEKWVVGYGHASVAEHAVAHVAIEDVSIVASKVIEDARLASYTEKSTRYVPFPRRYYELPELAGASRYRETMEGLFDLYAELLDPLTEAVAEQADRSAFKTERGYRNSCRAQACDALRYLLPAATHTNLGLTANARTLEHLISKLLSQPLQELREIGTRIKQEAGVVIPTLIKYARPSVYMEETPPALAALATALLRPGTKENPPVGGGETPAVQLVDGPADAELRLATAILYEFSGLPYETILTRLRGLPREEHERVIAEYLARRRTYGDPAHGYTDPPLRSLEHAVFTFDILVDYGAYRDIQRHRICTQTTQILTCREGFDTPELLVRFGFQSRFEEAMYRAREAWDGLAATHPFEAQYAVPLAYRKRVLFSWNLRALHHFISLRSARQGHPSYRRIAQEVYRALETSYPFLARFIRVDQTPAYGLSRPG